ncbi:MAG: 4Fe-4S dicluster domain-containing protein [Anaerolineales bacterium]|nr:4Fe-4S dicluster domain-containing protein [Anaerolineales bacterium]
MDPTGIVLLILGILFLVAFLTFTIVSIREGERRAARIGVVLSLAVSFPLLAAITLPIEIQLAALGLIAVLFLIALVLFILPVGQVDQGKDIPEIRFDERDIVFARARLIHGSPEFESYYAMRPENLPIDEKFRSLPGLLSPDSLKANPSAFASARASFKLTHAMREEVDGSVAPAQSNLTPNHTTVLIKKLSLYFGAVSVGITELKPYHIYTHIGRGSGKYGDPITLNHRYAIAFTVEMDHRMMMSAPEGPIVMESARQYVESAKVAVQLGYLIRSMGYPARAHIDGNYRVIAPLVARDAGLGEIGRMGILMTPNLGPRVRLGVVTTDLPLRPDVRKFYTSMIDYCTFCKKCAENCPSRSIPSGDRDEIDGALRWRIDPDTCFRYWNAVGTDCGICVAVCPYSHPDNFVHNAVRWGIERSGMARRASLWLDDVFYGRTHIAEPIQEWLQT